MKTLSLKNLSLKKNFINLVLNYDLFLLLESTFEK